MIRERERSAHAAFASGGKRERGRVAVHLVEARAHVTQAYAFGEFIVEGRAGAVIFNGKCELIVGVGRRNLDPAGTGALRDAVLDGVFDDGLQNHVGDHGVAHIGGDVFTDGEAMLEAHLHNREVVVEHIEFASEGNLLGTVVVECVAE